MVGKEHQLGFGEFERSFVKKQTRREAFLEEMEAVVPFSVLLSLLEPFYPPSGTSRGETALSTGGDATDSFDAELVWPQ